MAKTPKTFRLTGDVIKRIETLAEFFSSHAPLGSIPGQKQEITNTDIVEFAVNKYFEDLKQEGYSLEIKEERRA